MGKSSKLRGPGKLIDPYDNQFVPPRTLASARMERKAATLEDSTVTRPSRAAGPRERVVPRTERPDTDLDVMAAAEHFLERSKAAGTMQTGSAFALHKVFLDRVEVSQLRRLVNHHNGQSMWPDVLVTLVDMYWDTEANPRNEWAWKHFVTGKVFDGLLAYLLHKIEDAYIRQGEASMAKQTPEERMAYWERIGERAERFTPSRDSAPRRRKRTGVEGPSDQEFWEDDLEEWEAVMAKKRAARKRKQEEGL